MAEIQKAELPKFLDKKKQKAFDDSMKARKEAQRKKDSYGTESILKAKYDRKAKENYGVPFGNYCLGSSISQERWDKIFGKK